MNYRCYEDIKGQDDAWRAALAVVEERVDEVRDMLGGSTTEVLFTSCGSPYFLGLATASLWREGVGVRVTVAPSSEVMLFPDSTLPERGNLLLVVSRSGETTETIRAVRKFSEHFPGRTVVIGCRVESTLDEISDVSIAIPEGYEDVIPQTRSFCSMYLASQYLAALLAGDTALANHLRGLPDLLPPLLDRWEPEMRRIAGEAWDSAVFLGSGPLYGVAVEGALKLIEMSLTKTTSYHFLEVRHGPRSVIDEHTLVVGLGSRRGEGQEGKVLTELAEDASPHVLSFTSDTPGQDNAYTTGIAIGGGVPEHALGLLYLPLLQLLAYHRAVHKGVDPDASRNLTGYVELSKAEMERPFIKDLVQRVMDLQDGGTPLTLLAVCPNSDAVLEAAVVVAARTATPMLFAVTLNQVDRDGGYTGWTPETYVDRMLELGEKHSCETPLYACLDHGGPWLKDAHVEANLSLEEAMAEVKKSMTACLEAGYALLHVDPTVDRSLAARGGLDVSVVAERTAELILHSEREIERLGLARVAYEVGTEEVAGGLADIESFEYFLALLEERLREQQLMHAWPAFVVGKVGTDLHTTTFDAGMARKLRALVAPRGSLVKGHYSDWVDDPGSYPRSGMGGANVGPEFTVEEANALFVLCEFESALARFEGITPSRFHEVLTHAVLESGRWRKWLQPNEPEDFEGLNPERRRWLVSSGARYVWTDLAVAKSRNQLYENLSPLMGDPHLWVVDRIAHSIEKYVGTFNLFDAYRLLTASRETTKGART